MSSKIRQDLFVTIIIFFCQGFFCHSDFLSDWFFVTVTKFSFVTTLAKIHANLKSTALLFRRLRFIFSVKWILA